MEDLIKKGFLKEVRQAAKPIIIAERKKYDWIKNLVYDYTKSERCIISNKFLLINKENIDYLPQIFSTNPLVFSNDLTNYIFENSKDEKTNNEKLQTLRLKTVKEQLEFVLEYDTRIVCSIFKIEPFIEKIINPIVIEGVQYFPVEIEIIDICHQLHDLSKFSDWEDLEDDFNYLFAQLLMRKEKGLLNEVSGGECQAQVADLVKMKIYEEFIPQQDCIVIGAFAIENVEKCYRQEKLQIIVNEKAEDIFNKIKKFLKMHVTFREHHLHIPKDFRTKRYTVYVKVEQGEKAVMDIFELAGWQPVPYFKKEDKQIGSKFVMLHFLLIDLWIIRVVRSSGKITKEVCNKKINYIWSLIESVKNGDYPIEEFFGIYRDESIDRKLFNMQGKMFYPYYPWLMYKNTKQLRKIN